MGEHPARGTVSQRWAAQHKAQAVIFNTDYFGFHLRSLPATATRPLSPRAVESVPSAPWWLVGARSSGTAAAGVADDGRLEKRAAVGHSSRSPSTAEQESLFLKLLTQLKRPCWWQ